MREQADEVRDVRRDVRRDVISLTAFYRKRGWRPSLPTASSCGMHLKLFGAW